MRTTASSARGRRAAAPSCAAAGRRGPGRGRRRPGDSCRRPRPGTGCRSRFPPLPRKLRTGLRLIGRSPVRSGQTVLEVQDATRRRQHAVWVRLIESMPSSTRNSRDLRIVRRRLAADARRGGRCARRPSTARRIISCTPGSRSSKSKATIARIAVDAQRELGEVVGADREAVEQLGELVDQDDVVGDLAHDVDLEPVLAARAGRARPCRSSTRSASSTRRQNGHHEHDVVEPHVLAHPAHGPRIRARSPPRRPGGRSARRRGSRASGSPPCGSKSRAAEQAGVFVGLEVGQPHDHRAADRRRRRWCRRPRPACRRRSRRAVGIAAGQRGDRAPRSSGPSTLSGWTSAIGCALMCSLMMNSMRASPTPSLGSMRGAGRRGRGCRG